MNAALGNVPFLSVHDLRAAVRASDPVRGLPELARLDRTLGCDLRAGRAEVQSATPWSALAQALAQAQGIDVAALRTGLEVLGPTVGAAIGSIPALPDGRPFAWAVESLALVTADGELRCADRARHEELFRAAFGARGSVAAVYSATLRLPVLIEALRDAQPPVRLSIPDAARARATDTLRLFVPPAGLDALVASVREVAEDRRLPLASIEVQRACEDRESGLAWALGETAAVSLAFGRPATLPARTAASQARKALIDRALALGGRFDLDTGADASRAQVEAGYPGFSAFLAAKRRLDPSGRLGGAWFRHYAALFACAPAPSSWRG